MNIAPSAVINGTPGDDTLVSDPPGGNVLFGDRGNDMITTFANDLAFGGQGQDTLIAGTGGDNILFGGRGSDTLVSQSPGGNQLFGRRGSDTITTFANDMAFGGRGRDTLIAGAGGDNTLFGGRGADRFVLTAGEIPDSANVIQDFTIGTDVLEINGIGELSFFDIVSRFQPLLTPTGTGGTDTLFSLSTGAETAPLVILEGVTPFELANSPQSFSINNSPGNVVIDWSEQTFDALRVSGFPPAASTRPFAMVHTAIADAVQGILQTEGRSTYLSSLDPDLLASRGVTLPGAPANNASAEAAVAAAATTVLISIFTDPDSPVVTNFTTGAPNTFNPLAGTTTPLNINEYFPRILLTALDTSLAEIDASQAAINAGVAYGQQVAAAIIDLRANDGAVRDENGTRVLPSALALEYINGIESNENLNEVGGQDQQGAPTNTGNATELVNDGTVGRLLDGSNLIGTGDPIRTTNSSGVPVVNGVAPTTPGAWRRSEDTLGADGNFAGLASIEVADINLSWVLPTTSYFNDTVLPPPALDSARYRYSVAEVMAEGSLLDLPTNGLGSGDVVVNARDAAGNTISQRTTTVDGLTSFAPDNVLGEAVNDTDTTDETFGPPGTGGGNDFGITGPDGLGTTSADRTIIGHVWANAEGSYGPNYAWQKVAQQVAMNNGSSLQDTAQVFAAMNIGLADAFINIWDIKWDEDYFWRPVSSVRNADQIAKTADLDDNTWTPREVTPQHPCHPSGTSLTAGVAGTILANFYGDNQTFTVSADPHPNSFRLQQALQSLNGNDLVNGVRIEEVSRTYTSLTQAANECRTSRIYAGAHFRFATENGVNMGEQVASFVLRQNPFTTPGTTSGTA